MKKKIISVILTVIMGLSLLTGCGSSETSEDSSESVETTNDTLTMAINAIPESLWMSGTNDSQNTVGRPLYDLLAYPTADGYEYYLADEVVPSEDYTSVKFHLRDEAEWSDGTPITTADVEFTINYYAEAMGFGEGCFGMLNIIDDKTFELKTQTTDYNFFTQMFSFFVLMPSHPFDGDHMSVDASGYFGKPGMVTSGPYTVEEINEDNIILKAREDYYGGTPEATTLIQKVIPTAAAQQIAFDNGELSYFQVDSYEVLKNYEGSEDYNIHTLNDPRLNYLQINSELSDEAREAICLALNCQEIIDIVYQSDMFGTAANSVYTPNQVSYDANCGYEQNLEKAKELAKSSGLEGKTLIYIYNSDRVNMEAIGTVIQQQLAAIGVNVSVEGIDNTSFFARMWPNAYGNGEGEPWDLCTSGFGFMTGVGSGSWYSSINNPNHEFNFSQKVIDKVNTANTTTSMDEANKLFFELQSDMLDEYKVYPISYANIVLVSHNNVTGLDAALPFSGVGDFSKVKVN